MAVKIRLARRGRKKLARYDVVVADARSPRDGKFIQKLGTYNPLTVPATIQLDRQKALEWLSKGATPTDTVRRILSFTGVLYLKHLLRGVQLGVVKAEDVEAKFTEWLSKKEGKVLDHKEKAEAKKKAKIEAVVNTPAKVKEVEVVAEETPAAEEEVTPVAEATENTEATAETTETAE